MIEPDYVEEYNELHAKLEFLRYYFEKMQEVLEPVNIEVNDVVIQAYVEETGNNVPAEFDLGGKYGS